MIWLKNKASEGACPLTIPLEKVRFFKAGATSRAGKPGVIAYFTSTSYAALATFETQEEAADALGRLEAEIAYRVVNLKPYTAEFIEAESWVKSNA
jgi:hypothetical protein